MSKNPIINALATVAYIALVATFMSSADHVFPELPNPIVPAVMMLSLFVFSAAVTGYLVIGAPLQLFLEGQKKEAIALFGKTLLSFAVIAAALVGVLLAL